MKIAFALTSISREAGGLFEICRRLAQTVGTPAEINVFGTLDKFTEADCGAWFPVKPHVFKVRGLKSFGYAPGYARCLAEAKPDLVHVHGLWMYNSLAADHWSKRNRKPAIYTAHGMLDAWALRNSSWKKQLVRALFVDSAHRHAACFQVNSLAEEQSIRAFGLRNPICVIPNGIDLPDLGAGSREPAPSSKLQTSSSLTPRSALPAPGSQLPAPSSLTPSFQLPRSPLPAGRKTLLYLGRLHPKKNLVPLIRAWADVQRDCVAAREWTLAIAGWDQGGYEGELKQLSRELGMSGEPGAGSGERESGSALRAAGSELDGSKLQAPHSMLLGSSLQAPRSKLPGSVLFLGPQFNEAKAACYANCDAFILPSLSEGLPMVVLEAWAYAKPVVMTDECNLPEGFAARAALRITTDVVGIAAGLRTLVEMKDAERLAMGARGRELVATKFSWPVIAAEMRRVCEWAIGGGTPPESVRLK